MIKNDTSEVKRHSDTWMIILQNKNYSIRVTNWLVPSRYSIMYRKKLSFVIPQGFDLKGMNGYVPNDNPQVYCSVILKWEIFIEMRTSYLQPSPLQYSSFLKEEGSKAEPGIQSTNCMKTCTAWVFYTFFPGMRFPWHNVSVVIRGVRCHDGRRVRHSSKGGRGNDPGTHRSLILQQWSELSEGSLLSQHVQDRKCGY